MITATRFVRWMDEGATRPFEVEGHDGRSWVVKAHRPAAQTKQLFNELVAGRLAAVLGVPWPDVAVIELDSNVTAELKRQDFLLASDKAVGSLLVPGLSAAEWPEGGFMAPDFPGRNREHVHRLLPSHDHRKSLYGKNVFDNWVLMEDASKYDTLQIKAGGSPLFLDASHAFGGDAWPSDPLSWDPAAIDVRSPYLAGVLTEPAAHEPWLARLVEVRPEVLAGVLDGLPPEWGLDPTRIQEVSRLIASTPIDFVPRFRDWVEWEKSIR